MPNAIIEIHTDGPKAARMVSSRMMPGIAISTLTTQFDIESKKPL